MLPDKKGEKIMGKVNKRVRYGDVSTGVFAEIGYYNKITFQ